MRQLMCFLLTLSACKSAAPGTTNEQPTAVRLSIAYEASWGLDALRVQGHGQSDDVNMTPQVLLLLPDAWAQGQAQSQDGDKFNIVVSGLRAGELRARGETSVTPVAGQTVDAMVVLTVLPCGAWCTAGATQCAGDGVQLCEQRDDDSCLGWSETLACATGVYCSLGRCLAECVNDCAQKGEARCEGPQLLRLCGQADSDDCLDWLPAVACAKGETCSNGACGDTCKNECEIGSVSCLGVGTIACGDLNLDGCLEWGPLVPCAKGESCSDGACAKGCTNECTQSACSGLTWTQCDEFDLDDCLDMSPGTSCVPPDACREGACDDTAGCSSTPLVCNDPSDAFCIDGNTWRVWDAVGVCDDGTCSYEFTDIACPNCPTCDACLGVTCTTPFDPECADSVTLRTYSSPGTCTGGACAYSYTDEICATSCSAGVCAPVCAGAWRTTTVDSAGNIGSSTSLAVDASSGVHVSYGGLPNFSLKYAYKASGGSWTTTTVDSTDNVGWYTSLAVDATGGVHVSSYDITNDDLKYAYKASGGSWAITTVDSTGIVGEDTSLAVDATGGVHVSYWDYTNYDLKYAYKASGGTWTTTTVDSTSTVGADSSLAVDASSGVHVSYYSFTDSALKYAYKASGGSWTITTVDSIGDVGEYTSLAVDASGGVHVSYFDDTNDDLKYAYKVSGGSWTTTTVDSIGYLGQETSLAVDASGGVHVSYDDYWNGDLKYAYKASGGSWTITTVDSIGDVGGDTSLAVDASGGVHVRYFDSTNYALKYADRCP